MTVGKTRGNVLIPYDALGAHCEVSKLQACGIDGGLSIVIGSTLALPALPCNDSNWNPGAGAPLQQGKAAPHPWSSPRSGTR